jgi:hypothetical protein
MEPPPWFVTGNKVKGDVFPRAHAALRALETSEAFHESLVPQAALFHVSDSLSASMLANAAGQHSVAVSLLRGCLEALTLVDLGLQKNEYRLPRLREWNAKKRTAGDLRRDLERDIWSGYSHGLWNEPWSDFFGNLSRALHPYAHYSPELMGWQFAALRMENTGRGLVKLGPSQYDPLKATRITLLHTLLLWTVGSLVVFNAESRASASFIEILDRLRCELGSSGLLFREGDWGVELMPHVWFKEGVDWRQEA